MALSDQGKKEEKPDEKLIYMVCPDCHRSFVAVWKNGFPLQRPDDISKTIRSSQIRKFDNDLLVNWPCLNRGEKQAENCSDFVKKAHDLHGRVLGSAHWNVFDPPAGLDEVHDINTAVGYSESAAGAGAGEILKRIPPEPIGDVDNSRNWTYTDNPWF